MNKILVVEDDKAINKIISENLKKNGYTVFSAYNVIDAKKIFETEKIHCVISDLMLPIIPGEVFIKSIRETSDVHIIVVSAKGQITDKIEVLKLGADDFIVKPFNKDELMIKVDNFFKKYNSDRSFYELNNGEIKLDKDANYIVVLGNRIELTSVEYAIMKLLFQNKNNVLSRETILSSLYQDSLDVYDRVIDTHIKNIRSKVKKYYAKTIIKTIYGLGYSLVGVTYE